MASNIGPNGQSGFEQWMQGVGKLQSQFYSPIMSWLSQPILPGWSFGNITVNEQNSNSPATEYDVISQYSYGQQLGRLMDAVQELIAHTAPDMDEYDEPHKPKAYTELLAMAADIDTIKQQTTARRAQKLRRELRTLKEKDSAAYNSLLDELAAELALRKPLP